MGSGYEIVGYSDSYLEEDILQGEKFIPVNRIKDYEIDCICVCVQDTNSFHQVKNLLKDHGFIGEVLFVKKYFDSVPLYVPNLRKEAYQKEWKGNALLKGVILGLSYSMRGIACEKLKGDFYDFSWHGLDLYYNNILYRDAMQKWGKSYVDVCLMVIPYYYFDYDMSISEYQYKTGQIYSVRDFGWHNGNLFSKSIQEYIMCDDMFGEKIMPNHSGKKYYRKTEHVGSIEKAVLDNIWHNNYEKTVEENKWVFKDVIEMGGQIRLLLYLRFTLRISLLKSGKFYGGREINFMGY